MDDSLTLYAQALQVEAAAFDMLRETAGREPAALAAWMEASRQVAVSRIKVVERLADQDPMLILRSGPETH